MVGSGGRVSAGSVAGSVLDGRQQGVWWGVGGREGVHPRKFQAFRAWRGVAEPDNVECNGRVVFKKCCVHELFYLCRDINGVRLRALFFFVSRLLGPRVCGRQEEKKKRKKTH